MLVDCTVCFVALAVCVAGVNVIPARRRDAIRARIVLCVCLSNVGANCNRGPLAS